MMIILTVVCAIEEEKRKLIEKMARMQEELEAKAAGLYFEQTLSALECSSCLTC
jgi:cytochrome c peroxidase